MFKDVSELKDFIEWARAQKVAKVKVADIEFEISPLGLMDEPQYNQTQSAIATALGLSPQDSAQAIKEEEDLLFHSSS
jgi:hypothetical protein